MKELRSWLATRYGLTVERLEAAARGWVGETYSATTRDGQRYFVKVYPDDRLPPTATAALPVLAELHRVGLHSVSRPLPSTSGALHARLDDAVVVVFKYIDADPTEAFIFGGERAGELIATLHQHSALIKAPVVRETFEPPSADELWRSVERARQAPASDTLVDELQRFLTHQEPAIRAAWSGLTRVARACRTADLELVVTHGDWPFNLLQSSAGTLYLVDWDELLLAPAERDTWYASGDLAFWRGYTTRLGARAENALATAFYVHNRYFEELASFIQTILGGGNPARREQSLELLDGGWMASLRRRMIKG